MLNLQIQNNLRSIKCNEILSVTKPFFSKGKLPYLIIVTNNYNDADPLDVPLSFTVENSL
jgi:hypothetical protein